MTCVVFRAANRTLNYNLNSKRAHLIGAPSLLMKYPFPSLPVKFRQNQQKLTNPAHTGITPSLSASRNVKR